MISLLSTLALSSLQRISTAFFFDAKHLPEANITDGLCSDLDSEQLSTAQLFQLHGAPGHCAAWDLSKASRDVRRQHSSSPGHRSLTGHRMLQSLTWRRYENHRIQKCQMDEIGVMVDKKKLAYIIYNMFQSGHLQ